MSDNPILRWLDARQVPWRSSQAALIERHGVMDDPWVPGARVILLDLPGPVLPNLLRPMEVRPDPDDDPALPPTVLAGYVWTSGEWPWRFLHRRGDAQAALKIVTDALAPHLGSPDPADPNHPFERCWRRGPAEVRAICWPRYQHGYDLSRTHEREPRTRMACHVRIETGYRTPCSARELAWLGSFRPERRLDTPPADAAGKVRAATASAYELEFVREPCTGFEQTIGMLGRSPGGEALIFTTRQLYIVPVEQVDHVHVARLIPGRCGMGGSWLGLVCHGRAGSPPLRHLPLRHEAGTEALNEEAESLAGWLGVPFVLGPLGIDE